MSEKKGEGLDNIDSIISISIPGSEETSVSEKPLDVQFKIFGKRLVLTFSSFFAGKEDFQRKNRVKFRQVKKKSKKIDEISSNLDL